MDENFEYVFENLFSEFPLTYRRIEIDDFYPTTNSNLREIRNYINIQVNQIRRFVRSDAKFYLLNNYAYMVLIPYLMSKERENKPYPLTDEFVKKIKSDIDKILKQASSKEVKEISSHTISIAINDLWSELFSTSTAFWTNTDRY